MCYKLVLPTATKTEEEEEQMKSKKLSQKISQVHQVHWNYPSSLTFLSALTKLLSASVSFQSESSLVTWPNTARWFAKMDISASVQKQQGHWSASAIKHELAMPWKWTISAFFYKTCTVQIMLYVENNAWQSAFLFKCHLSFFTNKLFKYFIFILEFIFSLYYFCLFIYTHCLSSHINVLWVRFLFILTSWSYDSYSFLGYNYKVIS